MLERRSRKMIAQGQVDKIRLANVALYFDSLGITPRSLSELVRMMTNTIEKSAIKQGGFVPITSVEEANHIIDQITRDKSSMEDFWIGEEQ